MSSWKSARGEAAAGAVRKPAPVDDDHRGDLPQAAEITALELEVDPEIGCDPYNSTGQHLVEAIRSLQKD